MSCHFVFVLVFLPFFFLIPWFFSVISGSQFSLLSCLGQRILNTLFLMTPFISYVLCFFFFILCLERALVVLCAITYSSAHNIQLRISIFLGLSSPTSYSSSAFSQTVSSSTTWRWDRVLDSCGLSVNPDANKQSTTVHWPLYHSAWALLHLSSLQL